MERSYGFALSLDNFVELEGCLLKRLKETPSVRGWYFGVRLSSFFASVCWGGLAVGVYKDYSNGNASGPFTLYALAAATVILILWYVLSYYFQRSILRNGTSPTGNILSFATRTVSDKGISQVGDHHQFDCAWQVFSDVVETPNLVIFVIDPISAIVLLRSSIPEAEYDDLLAFSRAQIPK